MSKIRELAMTSLHGRGTSSNPTSRFEPLQLEVDIEALDPPDPEDGTTPPRTLYYRDVTRSILSTNKSPDVYFDVSVNPYRGCEHGCAYCYARPTHEYLGWSAGLDFETRILVKHDAPELLMEALTRPSYRPRPLGLSGITDSYQPIERHLGLTRRCLEVLALLRHPVCVITKSALVTRDLDLLTTLAEHGACMVCVSLGTLQDELARRLEPRAASPRRRLEAIERLASHGIPVVVLAAPMISGLNDHELPAILAAAASAGARYADYTVLRLPHGVKDIFLDWLDNHAPLRRQRVLHHIQEMRNGSLNSSRFGERMRGQGVYAEQVAHLFRIACQRHGLATERPRLSCDAFQVPRTTQLELF